VRLEVSVTYLINSNLPSHHTAADLFSLSTDIKLLLGSHSHCHGYYLFISWAWFDDISNNSNGNIFHTLTKESTYYNIFVIPGILYWWIPHSGCENKIQISNNDVHRWIHPKPNSRVTIYFYFNYQNLYMQIHNYRDH